MLRTSMIGDGKLGRAMVCTSTISRLTASKRPLILTAMFFGSTLKIPDTDLNSPSNQSRRCYQFFNDIKKIILYFNDVK